MGNAGAPLPIFLAIAVALALGAAWSAGRAFADTWRPAWQVLPAIILMTAAVRFLDYALFGASLISVAAAFEDLACLAATAFIGYRMRLAAKMVTQYPWLYRRAGPFRWRALKD